MSTGINSFNPNPQMDAATAAGSTETAAQTAGQQIQDANLTISRATASGNFAGVAKAMGLVPPEKSDTDLMALLQSIRSKIDSTQVKSSEEDIQNAKVQKKKTAEQRLEKLKEAAKGPPKWLKGLKKFGEVGGYITAGALIVGGAALSLTGLGATVGVPIMMAGVAMLAMSISTTTAGEGEQGFMQTGMNKAIDGIAAGLTEMGIPEEAAKGIAMAAVGVAITAAVLASGSAALVTAPMILPAMSGLIFTPENLGDLGLNSKEAMGLSIAINASVALVTTVASAGVGIALAVGVGIVTGGAGTAPIALQIALPILSAVLSLTAAAYSAASAGVSGTASIGEGIHNEETLSAEADAKELKAMMTKLLTTLQNESERVEEIMKRVQEGADIVMNVMSQEGATMERTMKALGAQRSMA